MNRSEIELFVDHNAQPFYKEGPFGETHTIKFESFCDYLEEFIIEDKKKIINLCIRYCYDNYGKCPKEIIKLLENYKKEPCDEEAW